METQSIRTTQFRNNSEALTRATRGLSVSNFPTIYRGFMEKGISESWSCLPVLLCRMSDLHAPDLLFGGTWQDIFAKVVDDLGTIPADQFICQNGITPLFGASPTQWSVQAAAAFITVSGTFGLTGDSMHAYAINSEERNSSSFLSCRTPNRSCAANLHCWTEGAYSVLARSPRYRHALWFASGVVPKLCVADTVASHDRYYKGSEPRGGLGGLCIVVI